MSAHRAGRRCRRRFPKSKPPGLNHSILTGTLLDDPRPGRNPVGEPVTFLRVEFPVADPADPELLWTWASCDVEISETLTELHGIRELHIGHAIVSRSVFVGLRAAVAEMKRLMREAAQTA